MFGFGMPRSVVHLTTIIADRMCGTEAGMKLQPKDLVLRARLVAEELVRIGREDEAKSRDHSRAVAALKDKYTLGGKEGSFVYSKLTDTDKRYFLQDLSLLDTKYDQVREDDYYPAPK